MSRTDPQMSIRLPGDLKPRLTRAAESSGRTINAEIVYRLERSFVLSGEAPPDFVTLGAVLETRDMVRALLDTVKPPAQSPTVRRPGKNG